MIPLSSRAGIKAVLDKSIPSQPCKHRSLPLIIIPLLCIVLIIKMCTRVLILPVLIGLIVFLHKTESAPLVARYQILPHVPGYVPVYIRKGDTPLEEINPELAEAFRGRDEKGDYRKALGTKLDYISSDAAPNATGDYTKNYSLERNNDEKERVKLD